MPRCPRLPSYGSGVAQEAALAILLRDHLSPEVRDALAAPWAVVFGDPLAPDDEGSRVA